MTRRRALGQHFLQNRRALHHILAVISPGPEDLILEIGAGKGVLTFPLARRAGRVIAVEKDEALLPFLKRQNFSNLQIIHADILRLDWRKLLEPYLPWPGQIKLVGNLPFSISSPLLFRVLDHRDLFPFIVFLLQKEVAERVSGHPGSKNYAPLSIFFHIFYEARIERILPAVYFSPPPKVESALISLRRRPQPLYEIDDWSDFQNFLRLCFRHRRKYLFKNLKLSGFKENEILEAFSQLALKVNTRPEQVDEVSYFHLFHLLQKKPDRL